MNTSWDPAPAVMLKAALVAPASPAPLAAAVNVYPLPALSIAQPANVATPRLGTWGFAVHVNPAPAVPVLLVMVSVIDAELFATGVPLASSTVTAGCWAQAVPPVPPPGCVVNANCAAAPYTLNALLIAPVSPMALAIRV